MGARLDEKTTEGLHVKNKAVEINASQETVNSALATVEHITDSVLGWIHDNQLPFCGILIVVCWWLFLRHRTKVAIATQKSEYEEHRKKAHNRHHQERLPLDEPPQRLGRSDRND